MSNDTIHITIRDDMSEELHLAAEEGMPKYVGAEASVSRIENGVTIRLKDYKGETVETVYEAIESIEFDDGIMTITLPDGREFVSEDLTGPQGPAGADGIDGQDGSDGIDGKDGQDGYTPVKGIDYFDGADGQDGSDGEDGFSPSASVSKVGATATITITDKDGTTTATINDGSIADETDPIFTASPAYGIAATDITDWNNKSDFSGSYTDLTDKPSIPTKTSDLQNDSNFVSDASYVHTDSNYTSAEKTKLSGIASGAEVNQNAFGVVQVGESTLNADQKTDTLILAAGSNISLTPNVTTDTVTIGATDTTYSEATTSTAGLMSASDKTKLNGVASGAEVNVQSDWSESDNTSDAYIANKPTTLSGYGITDAKIESGVITLGSDTITPLTSHQDISGKADKTDTDIDQSVITLATLMGWTAPSP